MGTMPSDRPVRAGTEAGRVYLELPGVPGLVGLSPTEAAALARQLRAQPLVRDVEAAELLAQLDPGEPDDLPLLGDDLEPANDPELVAIGIDIARRQVPDGLTIEEYQERLWRQHGR